MSGDRNVLGGPLGSCSTDPVTGWFRDGCCRTDDSDLGSHTVCVQVSGPFLKFSAERGNDLSTPVVQHGFPGLRPGDRWCLCAARWLEAYEAGAAPPVVLSSTHEKALTIVPLELMLAHALDMVAIA